MKTGLKKFLLVVFGVTFILLGIVTGLFLLAFIALYNLAEYYMCIPGLLLEIFVLVPGGSITWGLVLVGIKMIKRTRDKA